MITDRVELSKLLIYNVFIQKDEILCAERKNVLVGSSNRKMSEFFLCRYRNSIPCDRNQEGA